MHFQYKMMTRFGGKREELKGMHGRFCQTPRSPQDSVTKRKKRGRIVLFHQNIHSKFQPYLLSHSLKIGNYGISFQYTELIGLSLRRSQYCVCEAAASPKQFPLKVNFEPIFPSFFAWLII